MSLIAITIIFGAIFWALVFIVRGYLMKWLQGAESKLIDSNDRVRELAWWAAIGVLGVFFAVAHILVQGLLLTL